jgi:electron transfer flavoprotein beta subunit
MKARSKPLNKNSAQELGVEITPRLKHLEFTEPQKRVGGGKVKDVSELVEKLGGIIK